MLLPVFTELCLILTILWVNNWGLPSASDRVEIVIFCVLFAASSALAIMLGGGIATGIGVIATQEINEQASHEASLATLRSSQGISGSFFLGSGSIGSDMYYFYYESDGGNRYSPRQRRAGGGVYVYEEDRKDASVQIFEWHFKRNWMRFFAFGPEGETTRFRVPKGSILQGYVL